jgi:ribosomal protein S18 acetylase RimI-like enzyme
MEDRLLNPGDFDRLHAAFLRAFSNYAVPTAFDAPTLRRLMLRRGADLECSVGVFDGGEMVAFMVVAVDDFEAQKSAYDVFTGVVPSHRGQRLAARLFDASLPGLRERGVGRFVLEVIRSNEAAVRAYERQGFMRRRRFSCFEVSRLAPVSVPFRIEETAAGSLVELGRMCSWNPSWQNATASLLRAGDEVRVFRAVEDDVPLGFAAVVPKSRDLPQLVVDPRHRRRGVGTALLRICFDSLESGAELRVINVDESSAPDLAFFGRHAARSLPGQYEMVLPL